MRKYCKIQLQSASVVHNGFGEVWWCWCTKCIFLMSLALPSLLSLRVIHNCRGSLTGTGRGVSWGVRSELRPGLTLSIPQLRIFIWSPHCLVMHELQDNGSSDLRQLHKQDNIPPLIIHRAFRLVILILYFPLVRICQYHPDNWTLNGEISRQDPVRSVVKLSYWFQAREDRITIH